MAHFLRCRTQHVSCIDCGIVFDQVTVGRHTSCVTEQEKHGPKTGNACTQSHCGVCKLKLNGAVHALQHYDSKKHRAGLRRKQTAEKKTNALTEKSDQKRASDLNADSELATSQRSSGKVCKAISPVPEIAISSERDEVAGRVGERKLRLHTVIKKALRSAPRQRLKRKHLLRAVTKLMGDRVPDNLAEAVEKKLVKSKRFVVKLDRILLAQKE